MENELHEGRIQPLGDDLEWANKGGVSWRLIPDFPNGVLRTDESNPLSR